MKMMTGKMMSGEVLLCHCGSVMETSLDTSSTIRKFGNQHLVRDLYECRECGHQLETEYVVDYSNGNNDDQLSQVIISDVAPPNGINTALVSMMQFPDNGPALEDIFRRIESSQPGASAWIFNVKNPQCWSGLHRLQEWAYAIKPWLQARSRLKMVLVEPHSVYLAALQTLCVLVDMPDQLQAFDDITTAHTWLGNEYLITAQQTFAE